MSNRSDKEKKREQIMGEAIALGMCFGVILSILLDNFALVGLGLLMGIVVSQAWPLKD